MFSTLFTGLKIVFTPSTFLLITAGTILGVIFGAMPGVSASMAVALALPFAYAMNPVIVHRLPAAALRRFCFGFREPLPAHRRPLMVTRWRSGERQERHWAFLWWLLQWAA